MKLRNYLILLAVLIVASCSMFGKPDGRSEIERQIQEQSNGLIQLVSYTKTNGMEVQGGGYVVFYSARITFTDDCYWSGGSSLNMGKLFGAVKGTESEAAHVKSHMFSSHSQLAGALWQGWKPIQKGQTEDVSGQITFVKTDNGWAAIPP